MEKQRSNGQIHLADLAYPIDRVRVNEGSPQMEDVSVRSQAIMIPGEESGFSRG